MARRKARLLVEHPELTPSPSDSASSTPTPVLVTGDASNQTAISNTEPVTKISNPKSKAGVNHDDSDTINDDSRERAVGGAVADKKNQSFASAPETTAEDNEPSLETQLGEIKAMLHKIPPPSETPPELMEDDGFPGPYDLDEITIYPERADASTATDAADPVIEIKLPQITNIDKFADSIENAEDMPTPQLYGAIVNMWDALVTYQNDWMDLEKAVSRSSLHKDGDRDEAEKPRTFVNPRIPKQNSIGVGYQDQLEALVYGYQYSSHASLVGRQDPIKQRLTDLTADGRTLRQRVPTQKAAENDDIMTGDDTDDNGRVRRTRGQRRVYDSDDITPDLGRAARNRMPSSRLGSEVPEQLITTPGKRKGRPSGQSRVQELKPFPGDSFGNPHPFQPNASPLRVGVTSRSLQSMLSDTQDWNDRQGQGVFDSRPGTSSTMVTNASTQSSDSQGSNDTEIDYSVPGSRRQRLDTSDFEEDLPYAQRIQNQTDTGDMTAGDVPLGGSLSKRSKGGFKGWETRRQNLQLKAEREASEKSRSIKGQPESYILADQDHLDVDQDPSQGPRGASVTAGSMTTDGSANEIGKKLSRSELSSQNQKRSWDRDDGSRRSKASEALNARWAKAKAGGATSLAGTSVESKAETTSKKGKSKAATATTSTEDLPIGPDGKPISKASQNMYNRWASRKQAEAESLTDIPKIGRTAGVSKNKKAAAAEETINGSTSNNITGKRKRHGEAEASPDEVNDDDQLEVNDAELAAPPRKRAQRLVENPALTAQTENGDTQLGQNEQQSLEGSESTLTRSKRSKKPAPFAITETQEQEIINAESVVSTKGRVRGRKFSKDESAAGSQAPLASQGLDDNTTSERTEQPTDQSVELSFQPRKSGRARRETSAARSYQSERRSSRSSQKQATTPVPTAETEDMNDAAANEMTLVPSAPINRGRRQSRAVAPELIDGAPLPAEGNPEVEFAPADAVLTKRIRAPKLKIKTEEPISDAQNALTEAPLTLSQRLANEAAIAQNQIQPLITIPKLVKGGRRTQKAPIEPLLLEDNAPDTQLQMAFDQPAPATDAQTNTANPALDEEAQKKAAKAAAKSAKMSQNLKARWANGGMAGAVEKRKATNAAKKAAAQAAKTAVSEQSGASSSAPVSAATSTTNTPASPTPASNKKRSAAIEDSISSTTTDGAAATTTTSSAPPSKRPRRTVRPPPQYDGAGDSDEEGDSYMTNTPSLPRKLSEYEEFQQLSSPNGSPLNRGRRPAALRASQTFWRYGDGPSASEDDAEDGEEMDVDTEIKRQFASDMTGMSY